MMCNQQTFNQRTFNQRAKIRYASFRLSGRLSGLVVGVLVAGVLIAGVGVASAAAEEPWQPCAAGGDGVTLERRAVPGSKFYEYRASALVTATPDVVLRSIWSGVTDQLPETVKQRTMLRQSASTLLFYDQIKTKVVSDRDYTIRMIWQRHPQTGVIEVPFVTANELGPPPAPGYVRVPTIRGDWIITPLRQDSAAASAADAAQGTQGNGPAMAATRITYLCYSEPGGSIPAFMARGAQQDQVLLDIRRILARSLHPSTTTAAR